MTKGFINPEGKRKERPSHMEMLVLGNGVQCNDSRSMRHRVGLPSCISHPSGIVFLHCLMASVLKSIVIFLYFPFFPPAVSERRLMLHINKKPDFSLKFFKLNLLF